MRIAIYDLDDTLLAGSTFTPFLVFGAARLAPWRLALFPVWAALLIGHKLGAIDRTTLKRRGMRLMLGRPARARLEGVAAAFATARLQRLYPGARRMLDQDSADGITQVIATAAYSIYASLIASGLGIEHLVASCWTEEGAAGPNCYGPEKLARVQAWLIENGIDRAHAHIRFVSDSFADAPTLDWADEAWFVTVAARKARRAEARGWRVIDFSR
jgi:phosphatidylglycerophosphatase C